MESPAIQALREQKASALVEGIKTRIEETTPLEMWRWLAEQMYEGTCQIAHATRKEQEANS